MSTPAEAISRLEAARLARALPRRTVAAQLEMSEQQLYRLEKGLSPLKRVHLLALAEIYGMQIADLEEAA